MVQLNFGFGWLEVGFGLRWIRLSWLRLVLDLGWLGLSLELSWVQLDLELHFVGLGIGRRLDTDWVGLPFGVSWVGLGSLGLEGVHARGVGLRLLYLRGDGILGLEGCDGAGRAGQSVSVIKRGEGTSCREGMEGLVGSGWDGVGVVMQW